MRNTIILVGKTATGKTTVQNELIKLGFQRVVTYTTRPRRKGEVEDETYHYISQDLFYKLGAEGFFAETATYDVATGETWFYGSSANSYTGDTSDKVIILNPRGLIQVKKNIPNLDAKVFYLMSSDDSIRERLSKRGDIPKEIERRLWADKADFYLLDYQIGAVDYFIENEDDHTPKEIAERIAKLARGVKKD